MDDFKKLNDTYGHAAGDEFLKQPARTLRESVRDTDLLACIASGSHRYSAASTAAPVSVFGAATRSAVAGRPVRSRARTRGSD
ncbi:MAG: diguanylate cyclase [Deltaproteobacteria bacterium]|nr:diguanylate cyclase [Deltaproteobacteria bacterium]